MITGASGFVGGNLLSYLNSRKLVDAIGVKIRLNELLNLIFLEHIKI